MPRGKRPKPLTPPEIVERLAPLYGMPEWRPHHDAVSELVLTILSQNTSDTNSGRAFMRLISRFSDGSGAPNWAAVLEAAVGEVEREIAVGGLAKVKAPRIQEALRAIYDAHGTFDLGFLADLPLEDAKRWLRDLKGVGPKTAACVLVFALGRPALPVDTHVHRVAQRLGLVPEGVSAERAHDLLEPMLEPEVVFPFHVLMIKHGRRLCHARWPRCEECPLLECCPWGRQRM